MAQTRRVDVTSFGLWFVGALCGALLMFGINTLRTEPQRGTSSLVFVTSLGEMAPPVGGRLGGIASSDTANDALVRRELAADASAAIGGRLGGVTSSDTANDAMINQGLQRVVGPGEGLNQFVDTSTYVGSTSQRIVGPGEGLNQVP